MLKTMLKAAILATALIPIAAHAFDGPDLYKGETELFEAAKQEGIVVSFDTGPTWANWAAQFKAFQKRYPGIEIVYNDIGSAATVVTLTKSKNRPQADTAYICRLSAGRRRKRCGDVVQAGQFREAARALPPGGRQMVHHSHAECRAFSSTRSW